MSFELSPERNKESAMLRCGENIFAGRRNSKCKGPEVAMTSEHGQRAGNQAKVARRREAGNISQVTQVVSLVRSLSFSKCYESSLKSSEQRDDMT